MMKIIIKDVVKVKKSKDKDYTINTKLAEKESLIDKIKSKVLV